MLTKNFTELKDIIREAVANINQKDPTYNWSVHSVGKDHVNINWGYLDKGDGYFSIELQEEAEGSPCLMVAKDTMGDMIDGEFVDPDEDRVFYAVSYETAIKRLVNKIYSYANSRY